MGRLAPAGGVTDMDGVAQVEMGDEFGGIGGVVFHVVAVPYLGRPAMATTVVGDDAITFPDKVKHLRIPIVGAQGPTVMEDDRLTVAPVLVKDLGAVLGSNSAHTYALPCLKIMVVCGRPRRHGTAGKAASAVPLGPSAMFMAQIDRVGFGHIHHRTLRCSVE
jgi:hypothetical protein